MSERSGHPAAATRQLGRFGCRERRFQRVERPGWAALCDGIRQAALDRHQAFPNSEAKLVGRHPAEGDE